jgi:hypothetical protein
MPVGAACASDAAALLTRSENSGQKVLNSVGSRADQSSLTLLGSSFFVVLAPTKTLLDKGKPGESR